jgi:hypothetical protein
LGYISEDESFDAGYYETQKRRRKNFFFLEKKGYSIEWLVDEGLVDMDEPEFHKAVKKQETFLHINHQNKEETERVRLIKYAILWSKYTYAITFAIKKKMDRDKDLRAQVLIEKTAVEVRTDTGSDGEEESPLPMIGTRGDIFSKLHMEKCDGSPGESLKKGSEPLNQSEKINPNEDRPFLNQGGKHDVVGHLDDSEEGTNTKGKNFHSKTNSGVGEFNPLKQTSKSEPGRKRPNPKDPELGQAQDIEMAESKDSSRKKTPRNVGFSDAESLGENIDYAGFEDEDKDPTNGNERKTYAMNYRQNEGKFVMPEGFCAKILFVAFFPVHVLTYYCMPNIRYKPNLSKVIFFCWLTNFRCWSLA